jgi:hypothetical protein
MMTGYSKTRAIFLFSAFLSSGVSTPLFAQTTPDDLFHQKVEELSENSLIEPDFADLTEEFNELKRKPIHLNNATSDDLQRIPFLTRQQIDNFILYRETYGEILSIKELQAIPGFDTATIRRIGPYLKVGNTQTNSTLRFKELFTQCKGQILLRYQQNLQQQAGYSVPDSLLLLNPNKGYLGTPHKYYVRINYTWRNKITAGFVGEKDPGEQFFKGTQSSGMDYYSGFLCLRDMGLLQTIVLGNFTADFGQGLTFSTGASFGSLPSSGNLRRSGGRIKPSLSVNESNYLRGVATNLRWRFLELSLLYSKHKRDANMVTLDSANGARQIVTSLPETGYHRLPSEIEDKNRITELVYGGNLQFRNRYVSIGATAANTILGTSLEGGKETYDQFSPDGPSNTVFGIDFQFIYRTIYGFGEFSKRINGGYAYLGGIQANPGSNIHLSLIYRNYTKEYQNLKSNAIGQNSLNTNEQGVLLSIAARLSSKLNITAYLDIFRFPWLKYRVDSPAIGHEYSVQLEYTLHQQIILSARFREKSSYINDVTEYPLYETHEKKMRSFRCQSDCRLNATVLIRNRLEICQLSGVGIEQGYGQYFGQDVVVKPVKLPLSLALRYALFETDNYETRIYTYERDVPIATSVPVLDGKGIRCYLVAEWEPIKSLEVAVRYSQTYYFDREEIGSDLELIEGNVRSEIKCQLVWRFR